jgi:hypothetical protein
VSEIVNLKALADRLERAGIMDRPLRGMSKDEVLRVVMAVADCLIAPKRKPMTNRPSRGEAIRRAMLMRLPAYKAAREWMLPRMGDLFRAGWTRGDLFRINPAPGMWGAAWHWKTTWGRFPVSHRINQRTGAIESWVQSPRGDISILTTHPPQGLFLETNWEEVAAILHEHGIGELQRKDHA